MSRLRTVAAFAILACLLALGILVLPAYWRNYQFQQDLDAIARTGQSLPDEELRASVVDSAARLKLPVQPGQVRLRRSGRGVQIEVLYVVPVVSTVDLHFRPGAK
jgi:hypothetical protein